MMMFTKRSSPKATDVRTRKARVVGLAGAGAFVVALCIAAPVPGASSGAYAVGAPARQCVSSALSQTLATNQRVYGPGSFVKMTWSLRNSSATACDVGIGPSSPSFSITNSRGVEVWNNCYANDQSGACPMYLMERSIPAHSSYVETFSWDQRSGSPAKRVATGTYRLRVQFGEVRGVHSVTFVLAKSSARTIVVTEAQSGTSVALRVGERLAVLLSGPASYTWTEPVSSNQGVLERRGGTPGAAASATFVGAAAGQVRVTAVDNPNCYPGCLSPSRLFTLTVSVVG